MMKQTVYQSDFRDAFIRSGRKENFSYSGLNALYEYLTVLEDDTGVEQELDVIGLCCEWTEYESIEEFNHDYNKEYSSMNQIDDTIIIPINSDRFLAMNF